MKTWIFGILILLVLPAESPHPLHVSIMQMDHNENDRLLEVTLKSFIDDVELAYKNKFGTGAFLIESKDSVRVNDSLFKLIDGHVMIEINGDKRELEWVGWEPDQDEVFFYFQVKTPKRIESIVVRNSLLFYEYFDQTNIVHLKYQEENRSIMLTTDKSIDQFQLAR